MSASGASRLEAARARLRRLPGVPWPLGAVAPVLAAAVAATAVFAVQTDRAAAQSSSEYHAQEARLQGELRQARAAGYTDEDLAPVTARFRQVTTAREPLWLGGRPGFYRQQAATTRQLRRDLRADEARVLGDARTAAGTDLASARGQLQRDQQIGVDDASVHDLQTRLDGLVRAQQQSQQLVDVRRVDGQARQLLQDAQAAGKALEQEFQAIQQAAQQLIAQQGGSIEGLRQLAQGGIAQARNDAAIAAYESYGHRFRGDYGQLNVAYQRMEHFAALAGSADLNQVAEATAAAQRYGPQVHRLLFAQLPAKFVVVSFQAQHVWAYQSGQVAMDTPITTGIRGVTDYGTDFGPLKVSSKDHPWKMHSPYPKESPYYYPDVMVQWAVWFTPGKLESFHDASWEPDSRLGPGSQYDPSTRSHGCIHVPLDRAQWMYGWADVGTPVVVYPGDGQRVSAQLAQITTDARGHPRISA
jgi:lipoprotein-anchoring transpeptidase ErfK/SrfK